MSDRGENARLAVTPWRGKSIAGSRGVIRKPDNAMQQRKALQKMTECERETGMTAEQLRALQAEQRAQVLARLGGAS